MSWKIRRPHRQPEESDPLIARLHPIVFRVQQRLRTQARALDAIDVLRECLVCLEAASSHTFGLGWPTTDTTEYYGDGPDPANVDVVRQIHDLIREGVPTDILRQACAVMQGRPTDRYMDAAVETVGQRCQAITRALLKCLDLPTKDEAGE